MDIREIIARARRAQQANEQSYPVQLEIEQEEILWATEEEQIERFRQETFTKDELFIHQCWEMGAI